MVYVRHRPQSSIMNILDYPQTVKRLARRPRAERSRMYLSTLASPPVGVFGRGGYSARIIWHGFSGSLSGPSRPFHLPWREKSVYMRTFVAR